MKYIIVFINVIPLLLHLCSGESKNRKLDSVKIVNEVNNNPDLPWKADTYGFKEIDVQSFRRDKLGGRMHLPKSLPDKDPKELMALARVPSDERDKIGLPVNFTWLDPKTTKCPIGHIRDQSNCGSCWAVSTTSAFGDRFCIQSKGKVNYNFSQEFVATCSKENYGNHGCAGGYVTRVHQFMTEVGTITGGDYESDAGCQMYTIRPCGWPVATRLPCDYDNTIIPKCKQRRCNNDWYKHRKEPDEHVYKAKSWFLLRSNATHSREDRIREELFRNGPLTTAFLMTQHFLHYKKGVFVSPRRARIIGGHLVRVIGYGVENGLKYWHCANSWSTEWGEKGFFKILRGVDLLEFERWMSALVPKL